MTLLLALYGVFMNRWRGHASKYKRFFPRPLPQIALAIPYAYVTPLSWGFPEAYWIAGGVLIATTLGWLTGHGKFMDLGTWKAPAKDETLEFLIRVQRGRIPEYWYDTLGLAVTGIAVTLWSGIATGNPLLALSGVLKAPAYMIGRRFFPGYETAVGEALTGLFLLGALGILT